MSGPKLNPAARAWQLPAIKGRSREEVAAQATRAAVGRRLHAIRTARRLTISALAKALAVSAAAVSQWESGKRGIEGSNLAAVLSALVVPEEMLLQDREDFEVVVRMLVPAKAAGVLMSSEEADALWAREHAREAQKLEVVRRRQDRQSDLKRRHEEAEAAREEAHKQSVEWSRAMRRRNHLYCTVGIKPPACQFCGHWGAYPDNICYRCLPEYEREI